MAMGFNTLNDEHLRVTRWSRQLKDLLLDDLQAMKFVRVLQDFPDGTTLNIPSLGEAETSDFVEGQAIKYGKLDTGNFQFAFDQYKYSAHSITEKFKRDSFYSDAVISAFLPRQHRALMEDVEVRIFNRMNAGQTASSLNVINNANHRFVASGTNEILTPGDFSRARYALRKANVPNNNLCAVLDPSATFAIEQQANITNLLSPMAMAEDIYKNSLVTGYRFRYNIFGFDVYESNYLPRDIAETINAKSVTVGVANMFFSAAPGDTLPVVGGFRQMPTVQTEFNKDLQQTEYLTVTEYGFKLFRPENLVIILSDTDQV